MSIAYREWSPMEHVLNRIPVQVAGPVPGLGVEQEVTCLAAHPNFLAFGTSAGLVYWYDRLQDTLKKLDCFSLVPITCIQVVETVDLMVAVGSHEGDVTIFQIPKVVTRFGQESPQAPTSPQSIQQFSIKGVHGRAITALAWSVNGQKLISGDMGGMVNCSTVDYFQRQTTTRPVIQEDSEIVQLDYKQRVLLVSSLHDCLLVRGAGEDRVSQVRVGKKPRRVIDQPCGGVLKSNVVPSKSRAIVVRPNNRLWIADVEGAVQSTVIFKAALEKTHSQIVVINPVSIAGDDEDCHFEKVELLQSRDCEDLVVLWSRKRFHITNLATGVVIASCHSLRRIINLSVSSGEIFVLETGRTVIRIATSKDHEKIESNWRRASTASQGSDTETSIGLFSASIARKLPNINRETFVNISRPLKLPTIPGFEAGSSFYKFGAKLRTLGSRGESLTSPEVSSPAEEAFESSSVVSIDDENRSTDNSDSEAKQLEIKSPSSALTMEMYKNQMDRIGEQDFDDHISVTKKIKKEGKKSRLDESNSPDSVTGLNDASLKNTCHGEPILEHEVSQDGLLGSLDGLRLELTLESEDANKPVNAPNKVQSKRNDNELEDVTDKTDNGTQESLKVEIDHELVDKGVSNENETSQEDVLSKSVIELSKCDNEIAADTLDMDKVKQVLDEKEEFLTKMLHLNPSSTSKNTCNTIVEEARYSLEYGPRSDNNEHANTLQYGPPSDSSAATVSRDISLKNSQHVLEKTIQIESLANISGLDDCDISDDLCAESSVTELSGGWLSYSLPGRTVSLAVTDHYMVTCDDREVVYYSSLSHNGCLVWRRADFTASHVVCSSSGRIVWRVYRHTAYALIEPMETKPLGTRWVEVVDGVSGVAVGEETVWIVGLDGGITVHSGLSSSSPHSLQPTTVLSGFAIASLKLSGSDLLAVSGDCSIFTCCLDSVDCRRPKGSLLQLGWTRIETPCAAVADVTSRPGGELWLIDSHNNVYFSLDWHDTEVVSWSQVSVVQSGGNNGGQDTDWRSREGLVPRSLCRHCLITGPQSVYIVTPLANNLIKSPAVIRGYSWSKVDLTNLGAGSRLKGITAGAIQDYRGLLYMTQFSTKPYSDLLYCPLHSGRIGAIPVPPGDAVFQVAASPDHVWLLTVQGTIYIGQSNKWRKLDLQQLAGVRLVSLALGKDCVWAVDNQGRVYLRLGSLSPPSNHALPAWVQVDLGDKQNTDQGTKIVTVVCSTEANIVWCLDSNHCVYVREAVYPELPVGTSWLHVSGLAAVALAASRETVWVLTPTKQVFRRRGVTSTNWVGDAWEHIPSPPGQAVALSVSQCDTAWTLDRCGMLQQLGVRRLKLDRATLEERMDSIGDDWAVVY